MDYLGNRNLFISEFIIGDQFPKNSRFECIEMLQGWLNFKDNDRGMRNYRSEWTQNVSFLHMIDLMEFKNILNDLAVIYKKSYVDGDKKDFINYVFGYSLHALNKIISTRDFNYYMPVPGIDNLICYCYDDRLKYPILDFILEPSKEIEHYKQHYNRIVDLINNVDFYKINSTANFNSSQDIDTKLKRETPKTFEELFYNNDFVTPCINMLKEIQPPLIDVKCNYIGKSKGAFCVWVDELQRQGIIKHLSDRKLFASLLLQKIKHFSIDESMFGKTHRRAETQYRIEIKTLISQIKLSQDSQKGKLGK